MFVFFKIMDNLPAWKSLFPKQIDLYGSRGGAFYLFVIST